MVGMMDEVKGRIEYLRALRYELGVLPGFDQVQVCTPANRDCSGSRPRSGPTIAGGAARRYRHQPLRFSSSRPGAADDAVSGKLAHDPNRIAVDRSCAA
jgi:hypothetical protein